MLLCAVIDLKPKEDKEAKEILANRVRKVGNATCRLQTFLSSGKTFPIERSVGNELKTSRLRR